MYLFSVAFFFPWTGKLEKRWQLKWFCLILCTVVLMQITGMYFYCVSLYVLFKINQPYLFNLSSEKSFCVLSHFNHLPLDGYTILMYLFRTGIYRMIFQMRESDWFILWHYIFCWFPHRVLHTSLHFVYLFLVLLYIAQTMVPILDH